jgi:hypothetical protein
VGVVGEDADGVTDKSSLIAELSTGISDSVT